MMKRMPIVSVFCAVLGNCAVFLTCACVNDVHAQPAGQTAVEGHVYDARTMRPLANARIIVNEMFPDGVVQSFGTTTDANGFYSLSFAASSGLLSAFVQSFCTTSKGTVSSGIALYSTLQPITYRRDLYLTLPKNKSACVAQ